MLQRLILITLICSLCVTIAAQPIERPVAMVKLHESEAVPQSQFRRTVETMERQLNRPVSLEEKKQLLDTKINEILLIQAATKEKVSVTDTEIAQLKDRTKKMYEQRLGRPLSDDEFRSLVEQTGYTWDAFMKELRKGILAQKYLKAKKGSSMENIPAPTEKEIIEYFESNRTQFVSPEMVRFKEIRITPNLLSTAAEKDAAKKKAQTILREIKAGASFDSYWEVFDETGRIKIGSLVQGFIRRDDQKAKDTYGTDFLGAVFSLKKDEVSDLIVSKAGYHIILVLEKIPFKVLELDNNIPPQNVMTVRNYIKTYLAMAKEQDTMTKALEELVQELRKSADIKIFEEYLSW